MKPDDVNALRDRVRSLESDNADLLRDHTDLCALDPDGLLAQVVALRDDARQRSVDLADATAEAAEAREEVCVLAAKVRSLEFAAKPEVIAHDIAEATRMAVTMSDHLRLANDDVERLAGASVAMVLMERRGEIRSLTGRLNDALALVDRMRHASHEKAIARVDFESKRAVYESVVGIDSQDRVLALREAMDKACARFAEANNTYLDLMLVAS